MKIQEVIDALEQFAPLPMQEDYDNAGLQVGLTEVEVSGALLCLDVTEEIIDEAMKKNCNLIVSHHPLIFHKLRRVTCEDAVQRTVWKALEHHVTVVSMHTNMDAVEGGVNYKIAEKLGLQKVRLIGKKQVVEVHCSSQSGQQVSGKRYGGEGIIGEFPEPLAADDLIQMLHQRFAVECVQSNQLLRREIRKVALCGGAGSFLLDHAIVAGADAFITGEMHYHEFFGHDQQIQICVIGHYQSEQYTKEIFRKIIEDNCPGVRCCLSEINTNPILYFS
ncbi:MAG: Nif3-like dinuclear metal center hexameric protein [Prevotella sp.]|nr:Nif3-like dinuclear metal center hexameric protein [Prevotella sp.]MCH3971019.1 Nif3-like dinuclear metal center hexameric protein [Prevotella sp.]MCH3985601.1 Nif3-like dinuclear metal center hexameric protein [Prevotella sp.]MCH3993136.1 Nif3-like dinuclear metal center hexameric protein [Prevotella sp.]MCH4215712.1 Nif3-like dinuclear metal center hexameric protein [Prevotella sp.]MCH4250591.1 Nif3-like dinuclear metal center hexameric protein [Prevotella sp.]